MHDGFRKLFTEPGELEEKERADGLEKVGPRGVRICNFCTEIDLSIYELCVIVCV